MDESPILSPSSIQSQKKQIDDLRSKLEHLELNKQKLVRKLLFEKLSTLMSSSTLAIVPDKDPKTGQLMDIDETRTKVQSCVDAVVEKNYLQQVMSAYRLTGFTAFTYEYDYQCIRVDTFYNRRYHEPYLIIFKTSDLELFYHTLPDFICVQEIRQQTLPGDVDLFTRTISEILMAYVSRREQLQELKDHVDNTKIQISDVNESFTSVRITVSSIIEDKYDIILTYDNWASIYPTQITIEGSNTDREHWDEHSRLTDLITAFETNTLWKALNLSI